MLADKSHYCILSADGWAVEQCETGSKKEKVPGIYEEALFYAGFWTVSVKSVQRNTGQLRELKQLDGEHLHRVRGRVAREGGRSRWAGGWACGGFWFLGQTLAWMQVLACGGTQSMRVNMVPLHLTLFIFNWSIIALQCCVTFAV